MRKMCIYPKRIIYKIIPNFTFYVNTGS
jgi:hypothetical protein